MTAVSSFSIVLQRSRSRLGSIARAAVLCVAASVSGGQVAAQSAAIATTQDGTPIYFYGLAIAKAGGEVSGIDLRPRPFNSAGQGAVFVDRGEVDFGLMGAVVLREAYAGEEFYEGRALENLRAVARLTPFRLTFGTRPDSGIETAADLGGKRFPVGFDSTAFGDRLYQAMLATGGLTLEDVSEVNTPDWRALGQGFVRNDLDVNGLVVGSPTTQRYADQIPGYRAVSLGSGDEADAVIAERLPNARLVLLPADPTSPGIDRDVTVLEYDYWVYAHANTPGETVTALLQALENGAETMAEVAPDLTGFDPELMEGDIGVPLHPAAEAFYAARQVE